MPIEMTLMYIEIIYLWRALPFCSEPTKLRLLDMLEAAKSPDGIPFHSGMQALLKGCVFMSLDRFVDAEMSLNQAVGFEKIIKHDKHIMSFALYELAMIHINREEVREREGGERRDGGKRGREGRIERRVCGLYSYQ